MVNAAANTAATTGSSLAGSRQSIADNFDTFLQILITQLKNQNPLEPLDTNEFTSQLVQFTSVEQQLKTNEFLEAMMLANNTSVQSQAVSYIGKTVSASGAQSEMRDGKAVWAYRVEGPAENTTITIRDESGSIVYSQQTSLSAGQDYVVWDGTSADGTRRTSGKYSISIDARDTSGAYVPVTTEMMGVVEGVEMKNGQPTLIVGGLRVALSSVTAVHATPQEP